MSGLVLELQADSIDSTVPATDLLRKALVVARKLAIPDIQEWILFELNGYGKNQPPDYRIAHGQIKAWNPYNGMYVPIIIGDPKKAEELSQRAIGQAIGELESLHVGPENSHGPLQVHFSKHIEKYLMSSMNIPLQPTLHVSHTEVQGVIDTVRNTILDWSLKLEEEGITGEGLSFSQEEKQKAKSSTEIHIQTFQGILGDIQGSSVNQTLDLNINKMDFDSLSSYLESKGISSEDIAELKLAIAEDATPVSPEEFGEKTNGWIGKMVSKATSGTWQIGVGAAGGLLVQALSAYFGLG